MTGVPSNSVLLLGWMKIAQGGALFCGTLGEEEERIYSTLPKACAQRQHSA